MKIFKSKPIFKIYYDYILVLVYKISMSIYSLYGHIPNAYIIIYIFVGTHTSHTYFSLDQIRHIS